MRIAFEFPSSSPFSAVSAITAAVYLWDSAGTSSSAQPTGWYSVASGDIGGEGAVTAGSAELSRQYWFNINAYSASYPSAVFSSSALDTGIYSWMTWDDDGTIAVGQVDLKEEARQIRDTFILQAAFAALTGSQVVNTNLNEHIVYEDIPNASGVVATSAARSRILARYKLYNSYGKATSNNPVIRETTQVSYDDYIHEFMTGSVGSGLK